jgi:hypothetical protein
MSFPSHRKNHIFLTPSKAIRSSFRRSKSLTKPSMVLLLMFFSKFLLAACAATTTAAAAGFVAKRPAQWS